MKKNQKSAGRQSTGRAGKGCAEQPALARLVAKVQARLAEVVQADAIPEWLDTPNPAFDRLRPLEVIERGEIDHLCDMIFYLESGVAS